MITSNFAVVEVNVTVASPALQGVRTANTSPNGDYIVPFLPAGDYDVTFELQGFQRVVYEGVRIQAGAYPNPSIIGQTGRGAIREPSTGTEITEYAVTFGQPLEWPGKRTARKNAADAGVAEPPQRAAQP